MADLSFFWRSADALSLAQPGLVEIKVAERPFSQRTLLGFLDGFSKLSGQDVFFIFLSFHTLGEDRVSTGVLFP